MKRAVAFSFLLACAGVLLGDSPDSRSPLRDSRSLLQDLVQMTNAGLSDETVLIYAKAHRLELPSEVSAADLLWLRKSGVGEPVLRYMSAIDVRSTDGGAGEEADDGDAAYDSDETPRHSARADSYSDGGYGNYRDSDDNGYPDTYADSYYDNYPETYYNDYYPAYGAGFYPYPAYFFVNGGFFGRFRGRGHGFPGRRGHGAPGSRPARARSPARRGGAARYPHQGCRRRRGARRGNAPCDRVRVGRWVYRASARGSRCSFAASPLSRSRRSARR